MNFESTEAGSPFDGTPRVAPTGGAQNFRGRILVADDDDLICRAIASELVKAGFDVDSASDGQEAWEALCHKRFDLLVTDNDMPRLTGIELIERIRRAGMTLFIIVVSGTFRLEALRDDPRLGVAATIRKPFGPSELLKVVRSVLGGTVENKDQDLSAVGTLQGAVEQEPTSPKTPQAVAIQPPWHSKMLSDRVLRAAGRNFLPSWRTP